MFDRTVENTRRMTVTEPKVFTQEDRSKMIGSIRNSQKLIEQHLYDVVVTEIDHQIAAQKLAKLDAALRAIVESL